MNVIEQDIVKATEEWYKLIGQDHHKDRDCHWYVNQVYSYGNNPYFRIEHYGYLYDFERDEISKLEYKTLQDAQTALLSLIREQIKEYNVTTD